MALLFCVLDGLGINPNSEGNAVARAKTPTLDKLLSDYPNTTLITHGERVGLPEGQMGNSEVGHLNIGAGRVVEQWLLRIRNELQREDFRQTKAFSDFCERFEAQADKSIHLIGLCSFGGVHSHLEHLELLVNHLRAELQNPIKLHIITDGRDTSPTSSLSDLDWIERKVIEPFDNVEIASLSGRFYAMDRDQRWERVQEAYSAISAESSQLAGDSPRDYVAKAYEDGSSDEFLKPVCFNTEGISSDDGVIFWNFRSDRMREIVSALCLTKLENFQPLFKEQEKILCFTTYDEDFPLSVLFPSITIENYLGQVIAEAGLTQFRCAETEKYPHVTYFLNGGREDEAVGEIRKMIPSPRDVATYDLKPEMSAEGVCTEVIGALRSDEFALIVVNFANPDMVGHTGNIEAAVKAVEKIDDCLEKICKEIESGSHEALIFADHGNAEQMLKSDGSAHTAHTTFPVPCILISKRAFRLRSGGSLCDLAPSALELLGVEQPAEMTGTSLLVKG